MNVRNFLLGLFIASTLVFASLAASEYMQANSLASQVQSIQQEKNTPPLTVTTIATITSANIAAASSTTGSINTAAVSAVAADGLLLSASINATKITTGQNLNISVSLFNTLPAASNISVKSNWLFYGVPVDTWSPSCKGVFSGWAFPMEVVVLHGNYTAQELSAVANVSFPSCELPLGFDPVSFNFEPNSDEAYRFSYESAAPPMLIGPYHLSSSFTVSGYWNLLSLSEEASSTRVLVNATSTPISTPFIPGMYTVAVADEWGQGVLLHIVVDGAG